MTQIKKAECVFKREALLQPFGFKGSSLTALWQTAVRLSSENNIAIGLGVQSVLWSDPNVFSLFGEEKGNSLMFELTKYAVKLAEHMEFKNPRDLIDRIFPQLLKYGKQLTGLPDLSPTFVLNALVPLDFAAWILYAKENNFTCFENMTSSEFGFYEKQNKLANIPLVTYNLSVESVKSMADNGVCLFKIKIGSDPGKDGDPEKMLLWDKNRIMELYNTLKDYSTPYTKSGRILYYLDANGRYDSKNRLIQLLDFARKIDMLERIILFEEPFAENNNIDVSDLPVRFAADESIHGISGISSRVHLGYRAITLKPAAKTLSYTLQMMQYAANRGIVCFCADLTVNPVMVEWNKNIAARISPLPEMKIGILESNGEQNYVNWEDLISYHPMRGSDFIRSKNGIYRLDNEFYKSSGGIFQSSEHYSSIFKNIQ